MIGRLSAHDVSVSYASFGVIRMTVASQTPQPSAATAPSAGDSVTLSPDAEAASRTGAAAEAQPTAGAPAPADDRQAPQPSRASRQAEALLQALDADQNGAISKEEFVEGASVLLRRVRRTKHADREERHEEVGHSHGRHGHGGHRLERRLGRAFDRIDADGDGQLTDTELVAALDRLHPRPTETSSPAIGGTEPQSAAPQSPAPTTPLAAPPRTGTTEPAAVAGSEQTTGTPPSAPSEGTPTQAGQTAPAPTAAGGSLFSFSVTTVTYVSVAVQQYRSVDALRG